MVKGIVDRIEGAYAVVEFSPPLGPPFTSDIATSNFPEKISEGDQIIIFEINGIDLSDEARCVYKDITKAEVLRKFLEPLKKEVPCRIEIDQKATHERSNQVKSMISDLFK